MFSFFKSINMRCRCPELLCLVFSVLIVSAVGTICSSPGGELTFFHPGLKDAISCPFSTDACSTVGGEEAQKNCVYCCQNRRKKQSTKEEGKSKISSLQ